MALESFAPSVAMEMTTAAWRSRTLRTPTVVLNRRGDLIVRFGAGEHLSRSIRGARLVEMAGVDYWSNRRTPLPDPSTS